GRLAEDREVRTFDRAVTRAPDVGLGRVLDGDRLRAEVRVAAGVGRCPGARDRVFLRAVARNELVDVGHRRSRIALVVDGGLAEDGDVGAFDVVVTRADDDRRRPVHD